MIRSSALAAGIDRGAEKLVITIDHRTAAN